MASSAGASTGLFIHGNRETGEDVRISNVTAAAAVANIVKSSLGPVGLDKMLVDDIGDVLITNDGATILRQLEVEHPAGRVLVDLASLQDSEVGDGTTSVVIIAAELLKKGNDLIRTGKIHPTTIISGYRTALKAAVAYLKKEMVINVDSLSEDHLIHAAKTSMSSKILGKESDFFANMAVNAVKSVKMKASLADQLENDDTASTPLDAAADAAAAKTGKIRYKYPLSAIHTLKVHGKSSMESQLVDGFALNTTRASQGMPTYVANAKVAMLDFNLQRHRMAMGVQVVIHDPEEIERIKQRELDITKEKINKILEAGANVVLTTKGIDDTCMKYFVEAGVICARRIAKDDLKRLAKATGGKVVTTLADMEGNESFDPESLGTAASCAEERVGDGEMMFLRGCKGGACTVVLRGANEYMLDEMDRALHDSLCVVKRMLESNTLVAGGGAVEAALSVYLERYATTLDSREQVVIQEYADALLVIPKTLAVNAAKDSSELIAKLRAAHAKSQIEGDETSKNFGLDLIEGEIRDSILAGVVEPAISKIKSLRFATEAAVTILRIDDRIQLTPDQAPGGRR